MNLNSETDAVLNLIASGVLLLDAEHRVVYANRAAKSILGHPLVGKSWEDLTRFPVGELLHCRRCSVDIDHSDLELHLRATCQECEACGTATHLVTLEDSSDEIHAKKALKKAKKTNEQAVSILTKAKEQSEQLLEESRAASKAKSSFLANMSHEIRTPLNGIIGLTQLLQMTDMTPQQEDYLNNLEHSSSLLMSIINDILDFSKIESGKIDLESIDVNLRELVSQCECILGPRAEQKGIGLDIEITEDVPEVVRTDPTRIKQILLNLAGNAIKFTEEGKVSVSLGVRSETESEVLLECSVRDSGIGIQDEQLDKLFDSFTQADLSTTRKFGGTGLGLVICRGLAHLLNGEIEVKSEYGKGSVFTFTFTAEAVEDVLNLLDLDEEEDKHEEEVPHASTGTSVLLVEDNFVNQQVARGLLQNLGCTVEIAENGIIALEKLGIVDGKLTASNEYELIFMDVHMPEMDGDEATAKIREAGCTIPIVAMTARAMESDRQACLDAGMNDYISKPFAAVRLKEVLEQWTK